MSLSNMLFRRLIGQPLTTAQGAEERLNKTTALAVFSSDALSSTAYATEEILAVLAVAAMATGGRSFFYVLPISLVIAVLLWLITFSYRQTIHAYPSGGGAYIVAKENLGMHAGLTAAAALLVDYTLTVAVSISSGVAAITSAAQGTQFAWMSDYRVSLCLAAIALDRPGEPAGHPRVGSDLRGADLPLRRQPAGHDRLGAGLSFSNRRHSECNVRRHQAGRGLCIAAAELVSHPGGVLERLHGAHGRGGDLERRAGIQEAGVGECGHDTDLDVVALDRAVPGHKRAGLPLRRAAPGQRDRHFAVCSNHLHGTIAAGLTTWSRRRQREFFW